MISRFWWSYNSFDTKLRQVSQNKLGQSKTDSGLGFYHLEAFNQALLAKQAWRLQTQLDSHCVQVLRSRYITNSDFLNSHNGYRPNYVQRSIHGTKLVLATSYCWCIGNVKSILIRNSPWFWDCPSNTPLFSIPPYTLGSNACVDFFFYSNSLMWKRDYHYMLQAVHNA